MTIMLNIQKKPLLAKWPIRAFTLLESLLTLAVTCFLTLALSGSVNGIFQKVEEKIFFLSFENLYRDSQKLANTKQQVLRLSISDTGISNGITNLSFPKGMTPQDSYELVFDEEGNNSSLAKLTFQTSNHTVSYQLYLGSGNYKKTESKGVHSP